MSYVSWKILRYVKSNVLLFKPLWFFIKIQKCLLWPSSFVLLMWQTDILQPIVHFAFKEKNRQFILIHMISDDRFMKKKISNTPLPSRLKRCVGSCQPMDHPVSSNKDKKQTCSQTIGVNIEPCNIGALNSVCNSVMYTLEYACWCRVI